MKSLISWTRKFGSAQEMALVLQGEPRRGSSSGGGVPCPPPPATGIAMDLGALGKHSEGSEQLRVLLT